MMALPWHAEHADGPYLATARPQASVMTHLQHDLEWFSDISGLSAVLFFCNHDLWSWIVAKLHHSMPSVILHLLHKFKFSVFFLSGVMPGGAGVPHIQYPNAALQH